MLIDIIKLDLRGLMTKPKAILGFAFLAYAICAISFSVTIAAELAKESVIPAMYFLLGPILGGLAYHSRAGDPIAGLIIQLIPLVILLIGFVPRNSRRVLPIIFISFALYWLGVAFLLNLVLSI